MPGASSSVAYWFGDFFPPTFVLVLVKAGDSESESEEDADAEAEAEAPIEGFTACLRRSRRAAVSAIVDGVVVFVGLSCSLCDVISAEETIWRKTERGSQLGK
jgi:hypothetical protein